MEEYINRKELDFLNDYCIDGGKYAGLRLDEVFDELATKDVIERSKFDKAIEEMERYGDGFDGIGKHNLASAVENCISILKRNIGE